MRPAASEHLARRPDQLRLGRGRRVRIDRDRVDAPFADALHPRFCLGKDGRPHPPLLVASGALPHHDRVAARFDVAAGARRVLGGQRGAAREQQDLRARLRQIEPRAEQQMRASERGGARARGAQVRRAPVLREGRDQDFEIEQRLGRPEPLAYDLLELAMVAERLFRGRRGPRRQHHVRVAGERQRREQLHLLGRRLGGQHSHRRTQPQRGPHCQKRQHGLLRVQGGQVEDEPIEVAAERERRPGQRADPAQHRELHPTAAPRLIAGAQRRSLPRLDRGGEAQRLACSREGRRA